MKSPHTGTSRRMRFIASAGLVIALLLLVGCTRTQTSSPLPESSSSLPESGPVPADLRPGYQEIYLDLVARAYQADPTFDLEMALGPRWTRERLQTMLQAMLDKTPRSDSARIARIQNLSKAINAMRFSPEGTPSGGPARTTDKSNNQASSFIMLMVICFALLLAIGGVVFIGIPLVRGKHRPQQINVRLAGYERVEPTLWPGETDKPLLQFAANYESGDPRYDVSVDIERRQGEWLGVCGMGVSHKLDKDKATAFEVWLFDKQDPRTSTQVLVSEYAQRDETVRAKLAVKGDLVQAKPGQLIKLQTATLRAQARVATMTYATSDSPNSYFATLKVDMAVWSSAKTEPHDRKRERNDIASSLRNL